MACDCCNPWTFPLPFLHLSFLLCLWKAVHRDCGISGVLYSALIVFIVDNTSLFCMNACQSLLVFSCFSFICPYLKRWHVC